MAQAQTDKLQKVLASLGFGSRREMERWIADGRVDVNGEVATIGDRVGPADKIYVDGRPISQKQSRHRTILYNKPTGQICSRQDPEGRPTVFDKLPKLKKQRWISVGRLDYNTSGLLLLTTDGELANRLMHPSFQIEREYVCRVMGDVREEHIEALLEGVPLDDGVARFSDIVKAPGDAEESANHWYYVCLMEGRNREVRRLWESQGLAVSRLKRVRYGHLFIPSAVKAGKYVDVPKKELDELYRLVDLTPPA